MAKKRKTPLGNGSQIPSQTPTVIRKKSYLPAETSRDPLLQSYLREIQKYPLLSREEERQLALKYYHDKDRESLQKLVTSNLRFVVKIAYEYAHYRVKVLDLIQEGNAGLLKATQDFNPYKDVRLITYAVWWIRSYIQEAILKNYSLVKMGTTQAQKRLFYRLRLEQKKLEENPPLSKSDQVKLLASTLDVSEKEIVEMDNRLTHHDFSLNTPIADGEKDHLQSLEAKELLPDNDLMELEQQTLFKKLLTQFGDSLVNREKWIFENRLLSENPLTLQEIGDRYGITKERARQLEEQLKAKLKDFISKNYPDFELVATDKNG